MIEKVRSIAIGLFFKEENAGEPIAAAYSDRAVARQGVTKALAIEPALRHTPNGNERRRCCSNGTKPPALTQTCPRPFLLPDDLAPVFLSRRH
jgi:hypothetical protein